MKVSRSLPHRQLRKIKGGEKDESEQITAA